MTAPKGESSHHCVLADVNRRTAQIDVATSTPLKNTQKAVPTAR